MWNAGAKFHSFILCMNMNLKYEFLEIIPKNICSQLVLNAVNMELTPGSSND